MVSACRFVWSPWQLCITASPPALVPVRLHDHLCACFKLMFGERKKKKMFSARRKEGGRALGDYLLSRDAKVFLVSAGDKKHKTWKIHERLSGGDAACWKCDVHGNRNWEQCRLLLSSLRAVSEKRRRLPPPDRRRKTLFVCASLLEQSCAFIALMDCCVSA